MIRGIDASQFQNVIDWARVKASGQIQFAYTRATDGTYADPQHLRNVEVAKMRGIPIGVYHFFRMDVDLNAQIDFFYTHVKDAAGTLMPMLDVEEESFSGETSPVAVAQAVLEFTHNITHALRVKNMLIYTNWDTFESRFSGLQPIQFGALKASPLWVAQTVDPNKSGLFGPWNDWMLWQDATMNVPGISGAVDLDLLNPKHTLEDLSR